uniref:Uncharacterized protein n=1 Tax=Arion vulgaris TaxID=1028688 RepID=A0A0B6ZKZ4_9EUPU
MDIPLREDTLQLAREARRDQGTHETEVSFNGEADLKRALIMCDKNPGHVHFVPINDMTLGIFPESVQVPFVLEFMKVKAKETVRLSCSYTSHARPEGYIFHNYRGSTLTRYGSGRVWGVFMDKIQTDIPCPFPDCQEIEGPHMVSGYLRIHTAMHVVFDDAEAQRTTVDFFYDTPGDLSTIVTARGFKVVQSDEIGDYCVMDCVTHNPELCPTLDTIRQQWSSSWPMVDKIVYGNNFSVVVSHPHGCSKYISVGSCLKRESGKVSDDQGWYRYTYGAATCPGCSGAPVWVPGCDGLVAGYAPHCGHEGNYVNRSTIWFYWKPSQPSQQNK